MRKPYSFLCMMILLVLFGFAVGTQATATETAGLTILTAENPPLNFIEDGEIKGLATEVVRELVKRTNTGGSIRMVAWQEAYQSLLEQPNIALFSTVMTSERKNLLQWVGPLVVLDTNLYALKGSRIEIANLDDARKVNKIATVSKYWRKTHEKNVGF